MRMIPLQSTNLSALAKRPGYRVFYVGFASGVWYEYTGSEDTEYETFLFADGSQGAIFRKAVEGLPYRKLTDEEVEALDLHA